MKWQTHTQILDYNFNINHRNKLLLLGSCFAENIGARLQNLKFDVAQNPTGIVYNPLSLEKTVSILCGKKEFEAADLESANGLFFSYQHHSRFSHHNPQFALQKINAALTSARQNLTKNNVVFISLGTAFYWLKNNEVVNNCHKQPANLFTQNLASVADCKNALQNVIDLFKAQNNAVQIVFTISPIRHLKHGSAQNQLSKATLLVAAHEVAKTNNSVHYFPSYELVLDDLRDYRFYEEDLIHPNKIAVDYIWEKFAAAFFTADTLILNQSIENLQNLMAHRVFNPANAEKLQAKIVAQTKKLQQENGINFTEEIALWRSKNLNL